jgi:S-disulfanyl-L-cysteine oxidoreductase SoxD
LKGLKTGDERSDVNNDARSLLLAFMNNWSVKTRRVFSLSVIFSLAGTASCGVLGQSTVPSVLDGVFTEEQAVRGQTLYYQHCLQCHGETMAGVDKAPPLAGPQFGSTWNNAPLAALVARIQTMPPDKPASLAREEMVDILTYILWYNGLPLGEQALGTEPEVLTHMTFQTPAQ